MDGWIGIFHVEIEVILVRPVQGRHLFKGQRLNIQNTIQVHEIMEKTMLKGVKTNSSRVRAEPKRSLLDKYEDKDEEDFSFTESLPSVSQKQRFNSTYSDLVSVTTKNEIQKVIFGEEEEEIEDIEADLEDSQSVQTCGSTYSHVLSKRTKKEIFDAVTKVIRRKSQDKRQSGNKITPEALGDAEKESKSHRSKKNTTSSSRSINKSEKNLTSSTRTIVPLSPKQQKERDYMNKIKKEEEVKSFKLQLTKFGSSIKGNGKFSEKYKRKKKP